MKKVFFLILITLLLVSCAPTKNVTDEEMATRVAQILTEEIPTETALPTVEEVISFTAQPTEGIGSEDPSATPEVAAVILTATPTATVPSPTASATETSTPEPSATATLTFTPEPTNTPPSSDPRVILGNPTSTDPMNDENTWYWPTGEQEYTSLSFEDGFMKFTGLTSVAGWRLPQTTAATDIYIEMTVKTGECAGEDNYGIMFRIPVFFEADRGYLFSVSCDGRYRLIKWDGKEGETGLGTWMVNWKTDTHINAGANQTNRIGVLTVDDHFYLYANGYRLNQTFMIQDMKDPYPGGNFGIFVTSKATENFTIYVDEMSYWLTSYTP